MWLFTYSMNGLMLFPSFPPFPFPMMETAETDMAMAVRMVGDYS